MCSRHEGKLEEPYRDMVITIACLGLRVSELVGLRWGDIDFENLTLKIQRSFVRGVIYSTKTEASEGILPLDADLAEMLLARRTRSPYTTDSDYVFSGDSGKVRWPESMLHDHIKPAASAGTHSGTRIQPCCTPWAQPQLSRRNCYATPTSKQP